MLDAAEEAAGQKADGDRAANEGKNEMRNDGEGEEEEEYADDDLLDPPSVDSSEHLFGKSN